MYTMPNDSRQVALHENICRPMLIHYLLQCVKIAQFESDRWMSVKVLDAHQYFRCLI